MASCNCRGGPTCCMRQPIGQYQDQCAHDAYIPTETVRRLVLAHMALAPESEYQALRAIYEKLRS